MDDRNRTHGKCINCQDEHVPLVAHNLCRKCNQKEYRDRQKDKDNPWAEVDRHNKALLREREEKQQTARTLEKIVNKSYPWMPPRVEQELHCIAAILHQGDMDRFTPSTGEPEDVNELTQNEVIVNSVPDMPEENKQEVNVSSTPAQNATEAQGRILAILQPSGPIYPTFSKHSLLKAAKFIPGEDKDRAALVLDQLVSGGDITRTLDDTDDSISYVLTHTPPPDEDDEDEGEPEAPAEPEPPAENVAEEPAPVDPAPKPPAPEPAEEPTQESCNPRKALPCETCTCILQPDLKPDEVCGAAAVVTCDCGSWCTNGLCISVCEEALGWYSGLDEDPLPEPELAADGKAVIQPRRSQHQRESRSPVAPQPMPMIPRIGKSRITTT